MVVLAMDVHSAFSLVYEETTLQGTPCIGYDDASWHDKFDELGWGLYRGFDRIDILTFRKGRGLVSRFLQASTTITPTMLLFCFEETFFLFISFILKGRSPFGVSVSLCSNVKFRISYDEKYELVNFFQ